MGASPDCLPQAYDTDGQWLSALDLATCVRLTAFSKYGLDVIPRHAYASPTPCLILGPHGDTHSRENDSMKGCLGEYSRSFQHVHGHGRGENDVSLLL